MTYRNVKTGQELLTPCKIVSPDWVAVEPPTRRETAPTNAPKETPKKRGAKKGA